MRNKVLVIVLALALVLLATPLFGSVMAKPTQGQKTAVTVNMAGPPPTDIDPPVTTGPITHKYQEQTGTVTITFDDGSTLVGTVVVERKVIYVPQQGQMRWIFTDHYVFTFGDGGFEGNGKTILDGVVLPPLSWQQSLAYGLFLGTGDFEGQTLNIGHTWGEPGSTVSAWTGYWLKYQG